MYFCSFLKLPLNYLPPVLCFGFRTSSFRAGKPEIIFVLLFLQVWVETKGCSSADSHQLFSKREEETELIAAYKAVDLQIMEVEETRLWKKMIYLRRHLSFNSGTDLSLRSGVRLQFRYNHQELYPVISTMLSKTASIDLQQCTTLLNHRSGHYCWN